MRESFILAGARTPIGRYGGALARVRPGDLAALAVGAFALGHPLGAAGTRIVLTLLGRLERGGGRRGLATRCVGVGQGAALVLERP
ncbi:Probable beta-ketoadipyl-CoA thiolase [Mycobacterium tuberculosis]|nr:Probable beta-ketoadipyl-CoA thiolase [Mycobacterium tuberculosis]